MRSIGPNSPQNLHIIQLKESSEEEPPLGGQIRDLQGLESGTWDSGPFLPTLPHILSTVFVNGVPSSRDNKNSGPYNVWPCGPPKKFHIC